MSRTFHHRARRVPPVPRGRVQESVVEGEVLPHRDYFVPAFSVVRPLVQDEAAREFEGDLVAHFRRKPYIPLPLSHMGFVLLDRVRLEGVFKRQDVLPEVSDMLGFALDVRGMLAPHVKSTSRRLHVPLGRIASFGEGNNRVSVTSEGWRGFEGSYAQRDEAGRAVANAVFAREATAITGVAGQVIEGGVNGSGAYVEVSTRPLERQTPRMEIAIKKRGSISSSEAADLAGQIGRFMPPELTFYDPMIRLNLVSTGMTGEYLNDMGLVDEHSSGMFVRRPHPDDLESIGYAKVGSGRYEPLT